MSEEGQSQEKQTFEQEAVQVDAVPEPVELSL